MEHKEEINCVIIGDSKVGKTSLTEFFTQHEQENPEGRRTE